MPTTSGSKRRPTPRPSADAGFSPIDVDPARRIIDYGLTIDDLGPRQFGQAVGRDRRDLGLAWPAGLEPTPKELPVEPNPSDPMPRADVLVITWTIAEVLALADVLTPGINPRTRWYRYDRDFDSYRPEIRNGAPAKMAGRLASYYPTTVGSKNVLCVKSELHPNQDGIKTGVGTATLPLRRMLKQIFAEVQPKLVITVGTAGGTLSTAELGDVMITRAARFRCTKEFRLEAFNNTTYISKATIPTKHLATATALMQTHADQLIEPDFGPPTKFYTFPGPLLAGHVNTPSLLIDGRDFPKHHPMLTTDYFEFGTSSNGIDVDGCGVEMGDATFGLVAEDLGAAAPKWLVIRNASDPQINGDLPVGTGGRNMQTHWALWFYETFGYWTSVNSAIAAWAMLAP